MWFFPPEDHALASVSYPKLISRSTLNSLRYLTFDLLMTNGHGCSDGAETFSAASFIYLKIPHFML
jgi:hypothetical protein